MMGLGGGTCREELGHKEGAIMNGIGALVKEAQESSLAPELYHVKAQWEICDLEANPYSTMLAPWSQTSNL